MAATTAPSNPLITTKPPEAALNVQLHPLVLLTISDYITRHTSRRQTGPIVGSIIGQQSGRTFTLEHAYECKIATLSSGEVALDSAWFNERLEQYRDVHKAPALDLVGIFMLGQVDGPGPVQLQFVRQVQELTGSDSVMLLLFHPDMVEGLQGGKLPISLYESVREQVEGAEGEVKFRELSFEVETGEAEMIGVDFVATGAGVATAVTNKVDSGAATSTSAAGSSQAAEGSSKEKKGKGKGKAKEDTGNATNGASSTANVLSAEDEELLASLTAKSNAIKMLDQRLTLIRAYLESQPPSTLTTTDATAPQPPPETTNHTLLRSINAMLSRLPLLSPPTTTSPPTSPDQPAPTSPKDPQSTTVHLTTHLATLTRALSDAHTLSSKFHIYTRDRASKDRDQGLLRGQRMEGGNMQTTLTGEAGGTF